MMPTEEDLINHELFRGASPELMNKFLKYHNNIHELWSLIQKYAQEAYKKGRKRFSIWMIANRARWYSSIETNGKDFKISNDYLALYARLLILKYPYMESMFSIRPMKKDRSPARD